MSSHIRQILIAGAGTAAWWNAGDEAILSSMLQELRAQFPGVEIGVISANPKGALDVYQVQEIPVSDISALIEFARQSDLLVLGGGGLFYDYWGFEVENLLTESQGGAGIYVGFALLATLLEKPLMIYAVGVGPLFSDTGKHYTCLAFEQARAITVRDGESKELLISIGIPPEKIRVTADPVWRFPEISLDSGESLLQQMEVTASSPLLGVSVRPWTNPGGEEWESEVARALDDFIEQHGGKVLFIPFHKSDGVVDDHAQSEKVRGLMKHADSARILDADLSLEKKVSVLRCCDLVLGMRLHANIFAMRYRIPAVGLAYDPKVTNLFTEVGKPGHALDLRVFNAESLQFVLSQVWKERDALQAYYEKTAETMSALAEKNISLAVELAQQAQFPTPQFPPDTLHWIKTLFIKSKLRSNQQMDLLTRQVAEQQTQADSLTRQVAEQQTQADSLTRQVAEQQTQIDFLNTQVYLLRKSFSWKITRPLRFIRMLVNSPRQTLLGLPRFLWAQLPESLRFHLQRLRRRITILYQKMRGVVPELTWEEFQSQILASRGGYKGVFILYSTIDWNFPFAQRPQPLSLALAKLGYLVIYHTPNHIDRVYDVRQVAQNIWITGADMDKLEVEDAVHAVYSTSLTTPPNSLMNKRKLGQVLVYEYIDHVSPMISGDGENVQRLQELKQFAFSGGTDFIVASARQLEQEAVKAVGRKKVIYVPNGVDIQHYRNPAHQSTKLPDHLIAFRQRYRTVVGYFGAIAPWLWHEMMDELVRLRPDLGFFFIGPDYNDGVTHFPKSPNMLYLGAVDYKVLPAYARLFDICLIPFAPGEIAQTTSPLKLFEYFALEKPVVVTSFMDECVVYDEVFSGDSAHSISAAINAAMKVKDDPEYKARLALLAEQNSWDERAKAYEIVYSLKGSQFNDRDQNTPAGG